MSQKTEYFGKYILLEKLAAGGMAEVFLSRAPGAGGIGKFVAMKRILPQFSDNKEFVDMFKDEAKIAINLSHSNIVSIYEFGVESGQFFLVMEYVKGRNIRQILNKMKQSNMSFSIDQIAFMCKEIAGGLDHAHRCIDGATGKPLNITHRDMSPQNVMVSFEGEIKIIDFGIAKAETQMETTRAGTLKGKFGYMSPEQAEGMSVDLRTDIFSLGIVLWEMLANDRLFIANNEINTLRKIRDCQIPSLTKINPEVHPELERIVLKALTKDRNLRYQTAAAFHRDLSRFLNRHYPDFSSQDFSMFVKSLYADEILDLNNKLVEYSQIPFKAGGQAFSHEAMADRTVVMNDDHTLTETNNEPAQNTFNPQNNNPFEIRKKSKTKFTPEVETPPEPVSLPSYERNSEEEDVNRESVAESISPFNKETIDNAENMQLPEPDPKASINSHSFVATSNVAHTNNNIRTYRGNTAVTNPAYNVEPIISFKKPNLFKKVFTVLIYVFIAIFSYLFLATIISDQMEPLMSIVSDNLEETGICTSMRENGTLKTLSDFGFKKDALCRADKVVRVQPTPEKDLNERGQTEEASKAPPVSININSEPSGAQIFINGQYQNKSTPALISFLPGQKVTLELRKRDYKNFLNEHFDPNYLRSRTFKAKLDKIEYGYLNIDVTPPQFPNIYINGRKVEKSLPIVRHPIPAMLETEIIIRNPITKQVAKRKVFLNADEKRSLVISLPRTPASTR